jgi:hypothetical protein
MIQIAHILVLSQDQFVARQVETALERHSRGFRRKAGKRADAP